MKKSIHSALLLLLGLTMYAQTGTISGQLLDESGKNGVDHAKVVVLGTDISDFTTKEGAFTLKGVNYGTQTLEFIGEQGTIFKKEVTLNAESVELGSIKIPTLESSTQQVADGLPTVS